MTRAEAQSVAPVPGRLEFEVDCGHDPSSSWSHVDGSLACDELDDAPGVFWCSLPVRCHSERQGPPLEVLPMPEAGGLALLLGALLVGWLRR